LAGIETPAPGRAHPNADDWRTLTRADLGFSIRVPAAWRSRTARVKLRRFLGIPFELVPRWSDTPADGWNRLGVDPGPSSAALVVTLNPDRFPADLAQVLNDPWARALALRTVDAVPDVRIGGLAGFSVVQNLAGVGPKVTLGPVTVSAGTIDARLLQRQIWLRGPGLSVHVHYVVPTEDTALREVMERVVQTIRSDR
jgi:hypothetical protein